MDEEFAAARSRAFLAALDLHRAVLTAEPELMWRNLRAAIDVVNGDAPSELPQRTALAAWQIVFFVVPVISTTFASISRMFATLGREALGWLFIDEAGQAAPQGAVGALWRSQRAVVVGDPRQLEPVVTLPWSGQKRLCRQFRVDPQWAPQSASVQSVADRLNTFGTWLPEPDSPAYTWVGSPLRVHRRCDQLMFEVSNKIAYDNMMVYGVTSPRKPFELLTQSTWLDVRAHPTGSKWNPIEGHYVVATLDTVRNRIAQKMDHELADAGTDLPKWAVSYKDREMELTRRVADAVFVISPFRDIVDHLRKVVGQRLPSGAKRLGTIHTTQGKEADIVILALGTATDQARSRKWASQTPTLLNVAVTRARRRLVVIGDYRNWSQHLLRQHRRNRTNSATAANPTSPWLFPDQLVGEHRSYRRLARALHQLGIPARASRLASSPPAALPGRRPGPRRRPGAPRVTHGSQAQADGAQRRIRSTLCWMSRARRRWWWPLATVRDQSASAARLAMERIVERRLRVFWAVWAFQSARPRHRCR